MPSLGAIAGTNITGTAIAADSAGAVEPFLVVGVMASRALVTQAGVDAGLVPDALPAIAGSGPAGQVSANASAVGSVGIPSTIVGRVG
jgi:hypothetical protein